MDTETSEQAPLGKSVLQDLRGKKKGKLHIWLKKYHDNLDTNNGTFCVFF